MTDLTEAVKQAAREAVAKRLVRDGQHGTASDVRHGYLDHRADVADAIAGALAAVPVVREMVLREAAAVLRARRQELADLHRRTTHRDALIQIDSKIIVVDELTSDILALAEKEDTGR